MDWNKILFFRPTPQQEFGEQQAAEDAQKTNEETQTEGLSAAAKMSIALAIIGILGILGYALQAIPRQGLAQFFSIASTGLITAGAFLLGGSLIGFLFGIPRTLQQDRPPGDEQGGQDVTYRANTNLEQISDWLTKILVGVGLTQLSQIPETIGNLSRFLARGFGGYPSSSSFATVLVLYFSALGFLLGYLWTRLFLASALRRADVKALEQKVAKVAREVEVGQQASAIDPITTEFDEVLKTLDNLVEMDLVRPAIDVGRNYLRAQQYEKSKKIFLRLQEKVPASDPLYGKVLANLAYSEIGLSEYEQAIRVLKDVELFDNGRYFGAWHALAAAYAYFMWENEGGTLDNLKYEDEFKEYLNKAKARRREFDPNKGFFRQLYSEIKDYL